MLSLLVSCQKSNLSLSEGKAELVIKTIGNTTIEEFDKVGYTALEMLQINHDVKLTYGNVIKCIDNVCAQSGYWWPLYVNGKKASVGAQSYIVKNNDKVELVLSKK